MNQKINELECGNQPQSDIRASGHKLAYSTSAPNSSTSPSKSRPNVVNPTNSYIDYIENYVSETMSCQLSTFLSSAQFSDKNGRSVAAYGEPYHYTGSGSSRSTPMPDPIKELIERINTDYPESGINSCVINKYTGSKSYLPEHQDNEKMIRAGSEIFTISLGSSTTLKFRDCCSTEESEESMIVDNRSLYRMSQPSQYYWTHRSNPIDHSVTLDSEYLRYSITLRSVHKHNKNSTIIIGDSNTRFLEPGHRATFGSDMPGCRTLTYHIRDIDPKVYLG